jgi:hypothetical protein
MKIFPFIAVLRIEVDVNELSPFEFIILVITPFLSRHPGYFDTDMVVGIIAILLCSF